MAWLHAPATPVGLGNSPKPRTLITAVRQSKRSREEVKEEENRQVLNIEKCSRRCHETNWTQSNCPNVLKEIEEKRENRRMAGVEKRHKLESGMDSHLQSWLAPHSPPLLLPWQPDRRLGGGRSNEFLLSDRCRHQSSSTLVRPNDLPLIHQLKRTMCHQRSFYAFLTVVRTERKVQLDTQCFKVLWL